MLVFAPVRRFGALWVVALALVATLLPGGVASAHTDFESSTPGNGDAVDEPVSSVTVTFTAPATPVGELFIALTPEGVLQEPTSIETVDDRVFTLTFDPPLAGGDVGVRWSVQAGDAHPIDGAFSFTVNAPAPTTAPDTSVPDPTRTSVPGTNAPVGTEVPGTNAPSSAEVPGTSAPVDTDPALVVPADEPGSAAPPATQSLDDFLAVDDTRPGETTATIGRLVGFLGVVLGLGGLAFVAGVLRGRPDELRHALMAVRTLGGVIAVGALIEYVGIARIASESLTSAWSTSSGVATVLRLVGGVLLAAGVAIAGSRTTPARSLSAAVVDDLDASASRNSPSASDSLARVVLDARSWMAIVGVVLIVVSFWFDGHTVSKGFRPLHALVNSVHVVAGSVWVGGVVMMAAVLWSRHRSGRPTRGMELVVRFSKIATIALVAVVLAGSAMAVLVLDSFGDLTGTTWGQTFLLKTAAVGIAALAGTYNHFVMRPALEADPDSPVLLANLRNTLTAEAIMLVFVVAVTAWLVAAAS